MHQVTSLFNHKRNHSNEINEILATSYRVVPVIISRAYSVQISYSKNCPRHKRKTKWGKQWKCKFQIIFTYIRPISIIQISNERSQIDLHNDTYLYVRVVFSIPFFFFSFCNFHKLWLLAISGEQIYPKYTHMVF